MSHLGRWLRENAPLLLVLVALGAGYVALRSQPTDLASADELAALISGQPTLLYFYSNT